MAAMSMLCGTAVTMLVAVALTSSVSARNQAEGREPARAALQPRTDDPGQGTKPVLEEILNVDSAPPPETIEAMVADSAAVIVARYEGRRASRLSDTSWLSTRFALQIVERIKSDNRLPLDDSVDITLPGGAVDLGELVWRLRVPDASEPIAGRTYLVFLKLHPYTDALFVAWGPAAIYDVTGGRVTSLARWWPRHDGKPAAAFLQEVREVAYRRRAG